MSSKPQDLRPWTQIYTSALQQGEQPSLEKTNPSVLGREPGTVFPTEWATVNWLASKDGSDDSSQSLSEGSHPQETLWTPHLLQGSTVPPSLSMPFLGRLQPPHLHQALFTSQSQQPSGRGQLEPGPATGCTESLLARR